MMIIAGDEKPTVVQRTVDGKVIPNKLRQRRQSVVWRYEKDDEGHDFVLYNHPISDKKPIHKIRAHGVVAVRRCALMRGLGNF